MAGEKKNKSATTATKKTKKKTKLSPAAIFSRDVEAAILRWRDGMPPLTLADATADRGSDTPMPMPFDPAVLDPALPQITFPPTLSPMERRIVHKTAVKAGLLHASCGEGSDR